MPLVKNTRFSIEYKFGKMRQLAGNSECFPLFIYLEISNIKIFCLFFLARVSKKDGRICPVWVIRQRDRYCCGLRKRESIRLKSVNLHRINGLVAFFKKICGRDCGHRYIFD